MDWLAFGIFSVTYLLISARRLGHLGLDRPSAALLGAVACVACGVLSPRQALSAVDSDTLLLLFGVMGMGAFLVLDDFFGALEARLSPLAAHPQRLLGVVVWGAGLLSALLTNDAVCLLGTPLLVRLIKRHRLPPVPLLLALATGANTGSAATLVGNPQNMLCGQLGQLDYLEHLSQAAPITLLGLAINHAVLLWTSRAALRQASPLLDAAPRAPFTRGHALTLAVIAATALTYTLGASLSWTAAAGLVALLLLHRRDAQAVWRHIDWSLLLFFAGLFVVVEALQGSGVTAWLFARAPLGSFDDSLLGRLGLAGVFLLSSNLVSNVPFILIVQEQVAALARPGQAWMLLAITSTFAGNLTLLGSAANVIVAEGSRDLGSFSFWQHLKVGLPTAALTSLLATAWLWLG